MNQWMRHGCGWRRHIVITWDECQLTSLLCCLVWAIYFVADVGKEFDEGLHEGEYEGVAADAWRREEFLGVDQLNDGNEDFDETGFSEDVLLRMCRRLIHICEWGFNLFLDCDIAQPEEEIQQSGFRFFDEMLRVQRAWRLVEDRQEGVDVSVDEHEIGDFAWLADIEVEEIAVSGCRRRGFKHEVLSVQRVHAYECRSIVVVVTPSVAAHVVAVVFLVVFARFLSHFRFGFFHLDHLNLFECLTFAEIHADVRIRRFRVAHAERIVLEKVLFFTRATLDLNVRVLAKPPIEFFSHQHFLLMRKRLVELWLHWFRCSSALLLLYLFFSRNKFRNNNKNRNLKWWGWSIAR